MDLDTKQKAEVFTVLKQALKEDIGYGDITTDATIPDSINIQGQFIIKSNGIIAGIEVAKMVFEILDKNCIFTTIIPDGSQIKAKSIVATVSGNGRVILKGERVALNFMQRMSAVATTTNTFVQRINKTKAIILDTRKTMPGLRLFDKWAVRIGGGQNHRFGLYDMILIKDNHINITKSISQAVLRVRNKYNATYPIEIEVRNLDELEEALSLTPDRILLDNMSIKEIKDAVRITNGRIPLEVSGGVTISNVKSIAQTGVEYISVGALTHSATALDISLECI